MGWDITLVQKTADNQEKVEQEHAYITVLCATLEELEPRFEDLNLYAKVISCFLLRFIWSIACFLW